MINLQNGSDIRGIASEGITDEHINLSPNETYKIAKAFIIYLRKTLNKQDLKICVGGDSRISRESLTKSILVAAVEENVNVIDCGLATTPSMFMSTIFEDINADGSIMITASHLPFNKNGMKFFTKAGGLDHDDISTILNIATKQEDFKDCSINIEKLDLLNIYSDYLQNIIIKSTKTSTPLKGLHIIVDAGNGSGGFYNNILKNLGANVDGSQFLEPDGLFPNHIPNPENKIAIKSISDKCIKVKADLGIIFDTDVDRAAVIDNNGDAINRNSLIALLSAITLKEYPSSTIVTDSVTSDGLTKFIEMNGGKHYRYRRGYKNVINKGIELNDKGIETHLAIETSGHGAFKENYFLDDGAYIVTKILIELAKAKQNNQNIFDLISTLEYPKDAIEIRKTIKTKQFKTYGLDILKKFEEFAHSNNSLELVNPNYEGVKVNYDIKGITGFILIRQSLHDPVLPINIESNDPNGTKVALELLNSFLNQFEKLQ